MRLASLLVLAPFATALILPPAAKADDAALTAQVQQVLDAYVRDRASVEGLSGAALQIDRGAGKPILAFYAGNDGLADARPIGSDTLFQIGSNTKEFTAALILKLEAEGKLRIDDTIGRWLPQYPAWKDVTIRSLLQMTSPLPNYSETVAIGEIEAADIHHQFSDKDLIGFVDPANGQRFPLVSGWFYSNTNYILAALIIEAASGMNYEQALTTMILEAARAARHVLRQRTASRPCGCRPCARARASRPLLAPGLPRVPAGAVSRIDARAADRQGHADRKLVLGRRGGGHRFESARPRFMDPRAL